MQIARATMTPEGMASGLGFHKECSLRGKARPPVCDKSVLTQA